VFVVGSFLKLAQGSHGRPSKKPYLIGRLYYFADVLDLLKHSSLRAVCTVGNTKKKEAGARLGESGDRLISNTPWIARKSFTIMTTRVGSFMA